MDKLGPEPPGVADEQMVSLLALPQQWRNRYLSSRASMEADPVTWMTAKRGPAGFSPAQFEEWAQQHGYHTKAQNVRRNNLNAVDTFVTWEQAVGAAEVNRRFQAINASPTATEDDWTPTQALPTDATGLDIKRFSSLVCLSSLLFKLSSNLIDTVDLSTSSHTMSSTQVPPPTRVSKPLKNFEMSIVQGIRPNNDQT
ncbi:hypothetical protein BDR22DRAFT_887958 [Usnea florida]